MRRAGFTILELLVASLLLSMLVTMLTMIFNQSSIAWRTGVAGVLELDTVRASLGRLHDVEDDILPGLGQDNIQGGSSDNRETLYRTVSIFNGWNGSGAIQSSATSTGRLYMKLADNDSESSGLFTMQEARLGQVKSLGSGNMRGGSAFAVGVRSAGPDKKWDTADDISTFPEEVN